MNRISSLKAYFQQFHCLFESEHCAKKDKFYNFFIETFEDHGPVTETEAFALLVRDVDAAKYIKTIELQRMIRNHIINGGK